jgi:hypothetical protein
MCDFRRRLSDPRGVTYSPETKLRTYSHEQLGAILGNACPKGICPMLGKGFKYDEIQEFITPTGTKPLPAGRAIMSDTKLGSCAEMTPLSVLPPSQRSFQQNKNTKSIVSSMATSIGLNGTYDQEAAIVGGSFNYMTGHDVQSTSDVNNVILTISAPTAGAQMLNTASCSDNNILQDVLDAVENLPVVFDAVKYRDFLDKYGSYVLTNIVFGAKVYDTASTIDTDDTQTDNMEMALCAKVEGVSPSAAGYSVDGCAKYTSQQKQDVKTNQMKMDRYVWGGTYATRNQLLTTSVINPNDLCGFLNSATESDSAISYRFKPIWELLKAHYMPLCPSLAFRYGHVDFNKLDEVIKLNGELHLQRLYTPHLFSTACENLVKLTNMAKWFEMEYLTWECITQSGVDADCRKRNTTDNPLTTTNPNKIYHSMAECKGNICSESRMPCLQTADCGTSGGVCMQGCKKNGCHSNADCGSNFWSSGATSYCDGGGCFLDNHYQPHMGSYDEGINQSCHYTTSGPNRCDLGWVGPYSSGINY